MPGLFPKKPFYKQHEISASLSNNSMKLDDLHIFIEYPEHIPGIIKGYILGGRNEADELTTFMSSTHGYCQLNSISYENSRQNFESSKVIIRSVHRRSWPEEYSNPMTDIVAVHEMEELIVNYHLSDRQNLQDHEAKKEIVFFLAGPWVFWPATFMSEISYTGRVDITPYNIEYDLGDLFRGKVIRKAWFFHSSSFVDGNEVDTTFNGQAIHLISDDPEENRNDAKFIEKTTRIVNDLTLLVSFAARADVIWFGYVFSNHNILDIAYISSKYNFKDIEIYRHELVVQGGAEEFIEQGMKTLYKLRKENIDLIRPIRDILSGHKATTLEQKFTLYFLALEKIKDIYARKNGVEKNIYNAKLWKSMQKNIIKVIQESSNEDETKKRMLRKISELNRPPISDIIDKVLSSYPTGNKDLYPENQEATFFTTRNQLIHTAGVVDEERLYKDTYRVRSLAERIILRMLDWYDLSGAPNEGLRQYLAGEH